MLSCLKILSELSDWVEETFNEKKILTDWYIVMFLEAFEVF